MKIITRNYIEEFRQLVGNSPILGREIAKNEGYNDGKSDGLIEGQAVGEQKKQQEIIKTALENNFDVETIAKLTKVSVNEVLKIKESLE